MLLRGPRSSVVTCLRYGGKYNIDLAANLLQKRFIFPNLDTLTNIIRVTCWKSNVSISKFRKVV